MTRWRHLSLTVVNAVATRRVQSTQPIPISSGEEEVNDESNVGLHDLMQSIIRAMCELDADNIHRLVLKGSPPADGTPLVYHLRVAERSSSPSARFHHLVVDTPHLWQAQLYGCLKDSAVALDSMSFSNATGRLCSWSRARDHQHQPRAGGERLSRE